MSAKKLLASVGDILADGNGAATAKPAKPEPSDTPLVGVTLTASADGFVTVTALKAYDGPIGQIRGSNYKRYIAGGKLDFLDFSQVNSLASWLGVPLKKLIQWGNGQSGSDMSVPQALLHKVGAGELKKRYQRADFISWLLNQAGA